MFKRLRWMAVGATAGAGATAWARWKVKRAVRGRVPASAAEGLSVLNAWRREVTDAIEEGREAMRQREAELRAQLGPPGYRPAGRAPAGWVLPAGAMAPGTLPAADLPSATVIALPRGTAAAADAQARQRPRRAVPGQVVEARLAKPAGRGRRRRRSTS